MTTLPPDELKNGPIALALEKSWMLKTMGAMVSLCMVLGYVWLNNQFQITQAITVEQHKLVREVGELSRLVAVIQSRQDDVREHLRKDKAHD